MKKRITIHVRPEHFDRLDISCLKDGTGQYINTRNCPLYRALTAHGVTMTGGGIACDGYTTPDGIHYNSRDNHARGVEDIRKKLLAGQEYVTVTFTQE